MDEYVTVCRVGAIPEGRGDTFTVSGRLVAVFRQGDQYFAINDLCPHMGASLGAGEVCDGLVACPWHAWRFRLSDGAWADNPRVKTDTYPVRVVDGQVQVCVPTK